MLSRTQRAMEVELFVGFSLKLLRSRAMEVEIFFGVSLKLLRSRAMALAAVYGYSPVCHFLTAEYARAILKCQVNYGVGFGLD